MMFKTHMKDGSTHTMYSSIGYNHDMDTVRMHKMVSKRQMSYIEIDKDDSVRMVYETWR